MDVPLQDCSIEEQRGVVWFLWAEEVKPVEIHCHMLAQYGQSTMSQRKVYEWVERFKSGRTHVTDEGRSGRPSTSCTQDHIDRADAMIRKDRQRCLKWLHIWISAMDPHMPYCMMIWDTGKSAHGGFPRS